ncbi:hypothetical protein TYRP_019387 [Tyrophagus putrescentiae]|nr:hypothetical protein TYRP_019387 [Tyrophagus putrescentiae]
MVLMCVVVSACGDDVAAAFSKAVPRHRKASSSSIIAVSCLEFCGLSKDCISVEGRSASVDGVPVITSEDT